MTKAAPIVTVLEEAEVDWNWSLFVQWFVTVIVGAGFVKGLDLLVSKLQGRESRRREKATRLVKYLESYAKLSQLYRAFGRVESAFPKDEYGQPLTDSDGNVVPKWIVALEPERGFAKTLEGIEGKDLDTLVAEQIVEIIGNSTAMADIASGLDDSGGLQEQFSELYEKMSSIEWVLESKDNLDPIESFRSMLRALEEADSLRRSLRRELDKF